MAPSTRATYRETTPINQSQSCEYDTVKKTRFFNAYDKQSSSSSIRSVAAQYGIADKTARRWLHEREIHGSIAYRRSRKRSIRLGRLPKLSHDTCEMLVSPSRNPVRNQLYEAQIQYHNLNVSKRTVQRRLKRETNGAQRFKQAYIKKTLSVANRVARTRYGEKHQNQSVDNFWQYIIFTDEAHIDPSSMGQDCILRELGHRYDTENIQERGEKTGVKLHVAAWVNWHEKAEKLEFYNDEDSYIERPKRPPKPRRTMYESDEEFNTRILEWKASLPHEKEVKPKGNAMTQKYYTKRLLPVYIKAIQALRLQDSQNWLLQEDGDPSHGFRKEGLASSIRKANWIDNLIHPAQSPDLNPIEGIWNILKQRIRRRVWSSIEELKEVLQDEWSKITMEEVRARISDMPRRCKLLVETSGGPIKSAQW
jgi:hypothetical protein